MMSSIEWINPELMVLVGLGGGVLTMVFGLAGTLSGPDAEVLRMRAATNRFVGDQADVINRGDTDPTGIFKAFVPTSRQERTKIARRMRQAGLYRPGAVRNYYVARTLLGLGLPAAFISLLIMPSDLPVRSAIGPFLTDLEWSKSFIILTSLLVVGFYSPALWLKSRISRRRKEIEQGLPNALDLLQVAVEAGMGFDAAMNRVAHEMARVVPPIAEEFMTVQLEIQAGMDRDRAFLNLAERTGVDEMSAFTNVIIQSAHYGSSISSALSTYSEEMRQTRELRAQEKANKLPVKMSGIMALMMMPTLLMITLAPVVIRWVRAFLAV